MFYAALDRATALAETYVRMDGRPAEATIATFELIQDLPVLNLVNLPSIPSVFDGDEANLDRPALLFLHHFVRDFAEPVVKDGREHVEYVPSQVVTEYVRYRLAEKLGTPVRGILYESARRSGGIGCALFVTHDDCLEDQLFRKAPAAPFRLLADCTRTIRIDTHPQHGAVEGSVVTLENDQQRNGAGPEDLFESLRDASGMFPQDQAYAGFSQLIFRSSGDSSASRDCLVKLGYLVPMGSQRIPKTAAKQFCRLIPRTYLMLLQKEALVRHESSKKEPAQLPSTSPINRLYVRVTESDGAVTSQNATSGQRCQPERVGKE